ncbi:MAG: energy-coupling factor transporter transmembrane component T [Eubacteriales bacterium]|nr:energy-coupling factor transporter transmembrane component T [Eubacteriales bacterium]MDD4390525.1 energy-coupling factor transporter transmembrane component T [Eubacteriales bacterium]
MIRDITLGQYFPCESGIHKLDPRTKIIATIVYIIAIFAVNTFIGIGFAALFLMITTIISRVPAKFIARGIKPIVIILVFTFILNIFMLKGGEELVSVGALTITSGGLKRAFLLAFRLILIIWCSSILTLTTKPITLTDGLESMLRPLQRIGVPAHDLAMMMTIALRFIPILIEETDKIMKAQMARGADFETGNILQRARRLVPILVPLFISALRIAQDLAMAMEARCYRGGDGRTKMHSMKFARRDFVACLAIMAFLVIIIMEAHIL